MKFRYQHYKLEDVIANVMSQQQEDVESFVLQDINDAYSICLTANVFDLSEEGQLAWDSTKKTYDMKIDRVESKITFKLRDKLAQAQSANEMFRVFSKFNALFTRPRIRGAIQEYQNQLLATTKKDIQALQDKFISSQNVSHSAKVSLSRDFPSVSSQINWAMQLQRKLKVYMDRVQSVLGESWEKHVEGKQLKQLGDTFANIL